MLADKRGGLEADVPRFLPRPLPRAHEGKTLCISEDGDAFVVLAGPEFWVLGREIRREGKSRNGRLGGGTLGKRRRDRLTPAE